MAEIRLETLLQKPIVLDDPDTAFLLEDLQGNILKPHGRDHAVLILLQFRDAQDAKPKVKRWIRDLAQKGRVTSARKQLKETEQFNETTSPTTSLDELFMNFFLTAKGYEYLGIERPTDSRFRSGMKSSQKNLADPPFSEWESGYREDIHAAILLAHDSEKILKGDGDEIAPASGAGMILEEVNEFATPLAKEVGKVMRQKSQVGRKKKGEILEHFGYVDGGSQPLFLPQDIKKARSGEPSDRYDPSALPKLVLVKDWDGATEVSCGSYMVFRKLEQNVQDFSDAVRDLAQQLQGSDNKEMEDRAAALVVGRFKSGMPIVLSKENKPLSLVPNNFDYSEDLDGSRCPFHAHIRQVNPRGKEEVDRNHRIARRGISYGKRREDLADTPKTGVGLLFMCFQSDIAKQFEFIQQRWANDDNSFRSLRGVDPVIGQTKGAAKALEWPTSWGDNSKITFPFAGFVTLKGGEYFFAPSISGLMKVGNF
jgi:Dyp-type peroxidase family